MKVEDGTGKGYRAKVDGSNRLSTTSVAVSQMTDITDIDEEGFLASVPVLAKTANAGIVFYLINNSSKLFHVNNVYFSWNGGNTNHNRACQWSLYVQTTVPTANHTALTPANLKLTAANAAQVTAYYHDGVGDGMTVASEGALGTTYITGQGLTAVAIEGNLILPPNVSVAVKVTPEEAGNIAMGASGYFHEHD